MVKVPISLYSPREMDINWTVTASPSGRGVTVDDIDMMELPTGTA
jgi:hypothetical protein